MTPSEFIQQEKEQHQLFDWVLALVPPNAGGSDLTRLPDHIEDQLRAIGISEGSPATKLNRAFGSTDWARDAYNRMLRVLPGELKSELAISETLAVGSISDAEFNGYVYKIGEGHAIVVPTGALMLVSFAAEFMACTPQGHFRIL